MEVDSTQLTLFLCALSAFRRTIAFAHIHYMQICKNTQNPYLSLSLSFSFLSLSFLSLSIHFHWVCNINNELQTFKHLSELLTRQVLATKRVSPSSSTPTFPVSLFPFPVFPTSFACVHHKMQHQCGKWAFISHPAGEHQMQFQILLR